MTKDKAICSKCSTNLSYIVDDDYIELYCKVCDEIKGREIRLKLYELTGSFKNLQELAENEEIPVDMLQEALKSVEGDFDDKCENVAKIIQSLQTNIDAYKTEEKRLASKRKTEENKQASLIKYLEDNLKAVGRKRVNGKLFTLSMQKNPASANITDLMAIPKEYLVYPAPIVDKRVVLEDLKQGLEVPGAELKQSESLRIK